MVRRRRSLIGLEAAQVAPGRSRGRATAQSPRTVTSSPEVMTAWNRWPGTPIFSIRARTLAARIGAFDSSATRLPRACSCSSASATPG